MKRSIVIAALLTLFVLAAAGTWYHQHKKEQARIEQLGDQAEELLRERYGIR